MKPTELARASGVSQSQVSRILNAEQTSISDDDLASLLAAITDDPTDRAHIIAARMRDVCNGPGADRIQLSIGDEPLRENPTPYGIPLPLPPKLDRAFEILVRQVTTNDPHNDWQNVILSLANLAETGQYNPDLPTRPEPNLTAAQKRAGARSKR